MVFRDGAYRLDLTKDGLPHPCDAIGIAGAKIRHGLLSFSASIDDSSFLLFGEYMPRFQSPLWVKIEMSNSTPDCQGQVYWNTGSGFAEDQTATWNLSGDRALHEYTIRIPPASGYVYNLRLDPSNKLDQVTIKQIVVLQQEPK